MARKFEGVVIYKTAAKAVMEEEGMAAAAQPAPADDMEFPGEFGEEATA